DWPSILGLYDDLLALAPSSVVALNRAIARSMVEGPEAGLQSLEELSVEPALRGYYLMPAVRADLLRRLGPTAAAGAAYHQALSRPCSEPEQRFLLRRLQSLRA